MVARIDVAVMFQGQRSATFLGENAKTGTQPHPVSKGHIEELHKNASHVVANPFLKDLDEEIPVFCGFHAHDVTGLTADPSPGCGGRARPCSFPRSTSSAIRSTNGMN